MLSCPAQPGLAQQNFPEWNSCPILFSLPALPNLPGPACLAQPALPSLPCLAYPAYPTQLLLQKNPVQSCPFWNVLLPQV